MANVLIKIGTVSPDPRQYQDKDIVYAASNLRIGYVYAEHICWPRNRRGKKIGGAVGHNDLLQLFQSTIHKYMYRRTGLNQAVRIDLETGKVAAVGPKEPPDCMMRVDEFFEYALRFGRRPMFGSRMREYFYCGPTTIDRQRLSLIWDGIEHSTRFERDDPRFLHYPMGTDDKRLLLQLPTTDFDEDTQQQFMSPTWLVRGDAVRNPKLTMIHKRQFYLNWTDYVSGRLIEISDPNMLVDLQDAIDPIPIDKIQRKPLIDGNNNEDDWHDRSRPRDKSGVGVYA